MNCVKNDNITIYEALQNVQSGRYVMPAFQRQYVWSMLQIEKLWDSILTGYPIANFLFWHIDEKNVSSDMYFCNFLPSVSFNSRKQADSTNYELSGVDTKISDTAILDGQQRLTSLYISLLGETRIRPKYSRNNDSAFYSNLFIELDQEQLELDEDEYNSKKYGFRFTDKLGQISPTQFEVRKLLNDEFRNPKTRDEAIAKVTDIPQLRRSSYARDILRTLCSKIHDEKLIHYTELFDVSQDDALEIFVRFNSGGRPLRKAEITMSILEAYWPSARAEFGKVLKGGYEDFSTDFLIRSALMLYGEVEKSINRQVALTLRDYWSDFKKALKNLEKLLKELEIDIRHFATGWNVLIPALYVVYYNPDYEKNAQAIKAYMVRAALFSYFRSGTTAKLQQMKSMLLAYDRNMSIEMLDQVPGLRVTDAKIEEILDAEKGSSLAKDTLYYLGLSWVRNDVSYDQDHLHPYSRFDTVAPIGIDSETWGKWRQMGNKLPNLQLLESGSNRSKNDIRLVEYYSDMHNETDRENFRKNAIIPDNVSMELKDFGEFYDARKELLREKIYELVGKD